MPQNLWLNLPVADLARSIRFFEAIGFAPNPGPGNTERSASFLIGDAQVVLMLFAQEAFAGFTDNAVADTALGNEVLFSLGADSRAEVDDIARRAAAAGGTVYAEPGAPNDFMYGCGLCDPDGHRWNVLYMDPATTQEQTLVTNPPAGIPRVLARLAYANLDVAVPFLERAFGFVEDRTSRRSNADGHVELTEMCVLDSRIMLGRSGGHTLVSPQEAGAVSSMLVIYVEHIDNHFAGAVGAGVTVITPPTDMFWGDRRYEALDCEGHYWSIHEHLRDV